METLCSLLVIILTVHSVNSLKCYSCTATTNDECNKNSQDCQAPFDTCMTTVAKAGNVKGIAKTCSSAKICSGAASAAFVVKNGDGVQVTCCNGYLCNYSGAASVKLHRWLLVLPLILMSLLIRQHT